MQLLRIMRVPNKPAFTCYLGVDDIQHLALWNMPFTDKSTASLLTVIALCVCALLIVLPLPMETRILARGRLVYNPPLITMVAVTAGKISSLRVHEGQKVRVSEPMLILKPHLASTSWQHKALKLRWQQWLALLHQHRTQADQQIIRMTPLWEHSVIMDAEYRQYQQRQQQLWQTWLQAQQDYIRWQHSERVTVIASNNAVVENVLVNPNQWVAAGSPLLKLRSIPSVLTGEIIIPATSMRDIKPGQRVIMRIQAYPYQRFGVWEGNVLAGTPLLIQTSNKSANQIAQLSAEGGYIIHTSLRPTLKSQENLHLLEGLTIEVGIVTHHCHLWQWVRWGSCAA